MAEKRALLIFPKMYSMVNAFEEGFRENGWEVKNHDNTEYISKTHRKISRGLRKLSSGLRAGWQQKTMDQINARLLGEFHQTKPDIVLAYNSGLLSLDTMREMQKSAKVCFYMGDSPFYPTRADTYLSCLMRADLILCPDTYWGKQLIGMGIGTVKPFLIGSSKDTNYTREVSKEERKKWGSDLLFVGLVFPDTRGFKRVLFLNQFSDLDLKIYTGRSIESWYKEFPQLQKRVVHPEKRLMGEDMNTLLNCCKLHPVDGPPGLLNGVHWRIFESIGSGILPLAEYRKDLKEIFGGKGMPIISNYKMANDMASYYLKHDNERADILSGLQSFVSETFSPKKSIGDVIDALHV